MDPETNISISGGVYRTAEPKRPPLFPTLSFYRRILPVVLSASKTADDGSWLKGQWERRSMQILGCLEAVGCNIEVTGLDHLINLGRPCVFIGNHMSTLETFVLPAFILPVMPVTFIVKQSLVDYPVFGHIMRAANPITVTRKNPRQDLKDVLEQGTLKLTKEGISIVVFPQTTRSQTFVREHFNSLGIKLAKRAGVPAIPFALKTDAWGIGWPIKDIGIIRPSRPVRYAFGRPMEITGNGRDQHEATIEFIAEKFRQWGDSPPA